MNTSATTGTARRCVDCGAPYDPDRDAVEQDDHYYNAPYSYERGTDQYCLRCWLGVEPEGQ
jgi:hypothetical protein